MANLSTFKKSFFDRQKVTSRVEKARLKNLSKCGAFVRTAARSSLRRRKKTSLPGATPSVHSTDKFATLKNILFGYDPSTKGVIVGPVAVNGNKDDVPRLMERGGAAKRRAKVVAARTKTGKVKKRGVQVVRLKNARTVHYDARPFMWPALKKEKAKFAKVWRNSVKES
jgi:hypothetical protein